MCLCMEHRHRFSRRTAPFSQIAHSLLLRCMFDLGNVSLGRLHVRFRYCLLYAYRCGICQYRLAVFTCCYSGMLVVFDGDCDFKFHSFSRSISVRSENQLPWRFRAGTGNPPSIPLFFLRGKEGSPGQAPLTLHPSARWKPQNICREFFGTSRVPAGNKKGPPLNPLPW